MKIFKLLLLTTIFYTTILPLDPKLTPENTEINFDVDDVLIQKMGYGIHQTKLVVGGIAQNPYNGRIYLQSLLGLKKAYSKDEHGNKGIYDKQGNKIDGLTFQFLHHGIRDPQLTPYVAWMVETIENSRWFIPETVKICKYLKENKGYTINFATNKDRVSYDLTAQAFGDELTNIPTKVFVAHPGNNDSTLSEIKEFADLSTTPASYKELAYKTLTAQPTETIFHAPGKKPDNEYFEYVDRTIGTNKHKVFIDDNSTNVQAAKAIGMHGIHFKNSTQLAQKLIKLGILSEINDQQLLNEIGYSQTT